VQVAEVESAPYERGGTSQDRQVLGQPYRCAEDGQHHQQHQEHIAAAPPAPVFDVRPQRGDRVVVATVLGYGHGVTAGLRDGM
jgi:hypothetical protein